MEAADLHGDCLEPLFDMVPVVIVTLTAQIVTREGSQIATSIDEKLCVGDIGFLGEAVKERRPQNASRSDRLHESRTLVNAAGSVPRRLNTSTSSSSFDSASTAA